MSIFPNTVCFFSEFKRVSELILLKRLASATARVRGKIQQDFIRAFQEVYANGFCGRYRIRTCDPLHVMQVL